MRPLVEVIDMAIKKGFVRSEWSGSLDPDESDCDPLLILSRDVSNCLPREQRKTRKKKDSRRRA